MEIRMKMFLKILIVMLGAVLFCNVHAQPPKEAPIYLTKINPSEVKAPDIMGAIFLDQLTLGAAYTVTCDIKNDNYNKEYPVIVLMGQSLGVDPGAKLMMNGAQPKYRQALLNRTINKYVAVGVKRIWPQIGTFLYIRTYDDSDAIYISNCIATKES